MAAGKALADSATGVTDSTLVTAMARNGTDFGIRVSGLGERWVPAGTDLRRIVETGITPLINTGSAGRTAGTGQIGAGVGRAPLECFTRALEAFAPAS